jgi:hypothetical protein
MRCVSFRRFFLVGKVLAIIRDESLQLTIIDILRLLVKYDNKFDRSCVRRRVVLSAMEDSQLSYVIIHMLESVSASLYNSFLELCIDLAEISSVNCKSS